MRRLAASLGLSLAVTTALVTRPSHAADVEAQMQISARKIQLGEALTVQFTLMSEEEFKATNARLAVPAGLEARGPNTSSRSQMSISMNGQMQRQVGVTLSWSVTAANPAPIG
jgi:hypothetical protein